MLRLRLLLLVGALALAFAAPSFAATKLVGTVGPGFTIGLKSAAGAKVTTLKPGVYTFVVTDRSSSHDFHLSGPGVNKVITDVGFTGTKTVTVTLKKGTYRYVCDPHSSSMRGSFSVK